MSVLSDISRPNDFPNDVQDSNRRKERGPRPPNCFMIFSKEQRPIVQEQHPEWATKELTKELGQRWKYLHPDKKAIYQRQADEIKEDYALHPEKYANKKKKKAVFKNRKRNTKQAARPHSELYDEDSEESPQSSPKRAKTPEETTVDQFSTPPVTIEDSLPLEQLPEITDADLAFIDSLIGVNMEFNSATLPFLDFNFD